MNLHNDKLPFLNKIFYATFFIFAVGYLLTLRYRPYPFYHIVKTIPIISLSIIAFINIPGKKGKLIFVGLLFSAVGDFFLSIRGREYFVCGLIAFGFAQIMYILTFFRKPKLKRVQSFFSLIFIFYGMFVGILLFPKLDVMLLVPIGIYFLLLMFMGISSVLGEDNYFLVTAGALLFMVSDSIIAMNMFVVKIYNSSLWIMLTYYVAQFMITHGSINKCADQEKRLRF
jgi:alkenylglycerophosphocholine hydrolase